MHGRLVFWLAASVMISAGAAGCAGTPGGAGEPGADLVGTGIEQEESKTANVTLTAAEQRLRQQSRSFERTVWEGGFVGVSAGSLLGAYAAQGIRGVIAAAAAGGAGGSLAGAYVASKQKEYASAERQLDAMIADVQRSNAQAESLIATLTEVIAEDRQRLAAVQQRYGAGQANEAELAAVRRRLAENRAVVRRAVAGAREQQAMFSEAERSWRQQNPSVSTEKLRRSLQEYESQINSIDRLVEGVGVA
jgi:hypothetical protein